VEGGWMFFGLSSHISKLVNIQMSFNRPLEQYFYDPKSAKVHWNKNVIFGVTCQAVRLGGSFVTIMNAG